MNSFWVIGAIALTVWQAYGLWEQNNRIWQKRSAKSISSSWVSYFIIILFSQIIYAISKGGEIDVPLLINGFLQAICFLTILMGWFHFGYTAASGKEKAILGFLAMFFVAAVITLFSVPQGCKYVVFLIIVSAGTITTIGQAVEIYRRGRGVIDVSMLFPQCATNVYWSIYAFTSSHDLAFQVIGPTFSVLFGASIIIWFYRKPEKKQSYQS